MFVRVVVGGKTCTPSIPNELQKTAYKTSINISIIHAKANFNSSLLHDYPTPPAIFPNPSGESVCVAKTHLQCWTR